MTSRARDDRGFTLIEMLVVLAVIAIVTTLVFGVAQRQREQAQLSGNVIDARGLFAYARAEALASGRDVVVMVFPGYAVQDGGTGRLIVYRDGAGDFFKVGAPVNFGGYDPANPAAGVDSEVLETLDLDRNTSIGPPAGQGVGRTLPAPYTGVPLGAACTFCDPGTGRGAVAFDYAGHARFYIGNGQPLAGVAGGSLSLVSTVQPGEVRSLAVLGPTGALQTVNYQLH